MKQNTIEKINVKDTVTVGELIEVLSKINKDYSVMLCGVDHDFGLWIDNDNGFASFEYSSVIDAIMEEQKLHKNNL